MKRLNFSLLCILFPLLLWAQDYAFIAKYDGFREDNKVDYCLYDTISSVADEAQNEGSDTVSGKFYNHRYENRVLRVQQRWMAMIPNKAMIQYAGNIGAFSVGIGWDYGKREQWETYVIAGYLPKYHSRDDYWTFTMKESYTPWEIKASKVISIQPFYATFMVNSIFSNEFWVNEPDRYPKGYYGFSSKLRFHIGFGQKLSFDPSYHKLRWFKRFSVFYEVTSCDLYIRQKVLNRTIPFKDIICIGVGIQYKVF